MKRNILFAVCLCVGFTFASCNLDQFPQADIAPENSFKTETELNYYLNSLLPSMSSYVEGGVYEIADNGVQPSLPDYITGMRSSSVSAGSWDWGTLRKVNIYFKYHNNCKDEAVRKKYDGIAYCIRANFYYNKLKTFGGVPWYDTVLEDDQLDLLYKGRDTRDFVAQKILEDVDKAIEMAPEAVKLNEVTKYTALALKTRFCLFEGTFRKYHGLENSEFWLKECVKAASALIASGAYQIDKGSGTATAYRDLFCQPETSDASTTEVILARSYSIGLGVKHNTNYQINNISGRQYSLDKSLINSYLMKDGTRFTDKPGYATMTMVQECKDRDPRLAQTVRTPGFIRVGATANALADVQNAVKVAATGYMPIKYVQDAGHDAQSQNDNDLIAFRYAEVLLAYAEAKAELGTLTQNDLNLSITPIRERVGMPALSMADANANPDPFLADQYPAVSGENKGVILEIRRERRIELVMEGLRYDDIMRWKAGALMTRQSKGIYVPTVSGIIGYSLSEDTAEHKDPVTGDMIFYLDGYSPASTNNALLVNTGIFLSGGTSGNKIISSHGTKLWDEDRDYLAPIPKEEIVINPNLEQNPKW